MVRSVADQNVSELGGRLSVLARQKKDHVALDELLLDLSATTGAAQQRVLLRIHRLVFPHAFAEEAVLWPVIRRALQAALPRRRLRSLGLAWELVRRTAPTRAHPVVARRPPGNVVAAVPLSVVDRVRDLVDAAAFRAPGRAAPALRAAGRGLAGAAHRIERLPVMRRGEDPSTRREGIPPSSPDR